MKTLVLFIKIRLKKLKKAYVHASYIFIDQNLLSTYATNMLKYGWPREYIKQHIAFVLKFKSNQLVNNIIRYYKYIWKVNNSNNTKDEIMYIFFSVLCWFGILINNLELDLYSLYCIPTLYKCPYKQSFIAMSSEFTAYFISN